MESIKILVVEDEVLIAEDIIVRLLNMGYNIANMVDNVEEAVNRLESIPIDLVLIDIALSGAQTGIDLAKTINERFQIPFIFLTSLIDSDTVKKAGETKPAAYLLKPFNDNQMHISIEMALTDYYGDKSCVPDKIKVPNKEQPLLNKTGELFLKKDTHYEKVELMDILWLEADSNYTFIYTQSGRFMYSTVLKSFEDKLPGDIFVRVHRSYIVNMCSITGLEGNMLLIGEKQIPVSKTLREEVFSRFKVI
jgi:DNA-binding LytR/AlgR family response regulator